MIPILSAKQFKQIDQRTCRQENITEIQLMERAASCCMDILVKHLDARDRIAVLCGPGNNGGDGIAIGRMLRNTGYETEIFSFEGKKSPACTIQAEKTTNLHNLAAFQPALFDVIIDALFGTGISRPVEDEMQSLIEKINTAHATVISVDIPSGISADKILGGNAVQADVTCIIGAHKLTQFFPETAGYYGKAELVQLYPGNLLSLYEHKAVLDCGGVSSLLHLRQKFSHKGMYGHALLVAGSTGKAGAAILAANACVRSGVGLLTVETPMSCLLPLQVKVPEAMVRVNGSDALTGEPDTNGFTAVGFGPGLTTDGKVTKAISSLFANELPKVIDADALNILSVNTAIKVRNAVFTPHPKEFSRLVGAKWKNSLERYEMAQDFAAKTGVVLVLKDAVTAIFSPDGRVAFNSTGNAGMATGGMGDTLTGIILSLLAQNYSLWDAARIAVFHHGLAGDKVALERGQAAVTPSDLIERLRVESCR